MQSGSGSDGRVPRLDVVVPVYNEADCLPELLRRIDAVRVQLHERVVDLHVILVDDGSSDGSAALMDTAMAANRWISTIHLARNFGHQAAMTSGLDAARGDFVCVIDADLQDPPELIPAMLARLKEENADVVFGVREQRHGESRFKLKTANLFYRLLRRASGIDIPLDTGDFRLMRARVVDALRVLPEHNRFVRALVPWLGYKSVGFNYTRDRRYAGETKYPLRKMIVLAAHAIFSFSTMPIRLVQMTGILLAAIGAGALGMLAVLSLFGVISVGMLAWIAFGFVTQTGVVLLGVGVVGGYVFRIQDEVKGRPLYVRSDGAPGERETALPSTRLPQSTPPETLWLER